MHNIKHLKLEMKAVIFTVAVIVLQACSGGSGGGASDREGVVDNASAENFVYSGPVPANSEVQNFKSAFYDNVVIRCGSCHTRGGVGPTAFVDNEDVNFAWAEAKKVANLLDPSTSAVVNRVASGHNCWLNSNASCATSMTGYIERWAQGASQSVSTVLLLPRTGRALAGLQILPPNYSDFQAEVAASANPAFDLTVAPQLLHLLKTYCSECHSGNSATPQAPYFGSDDPSTAYAAIATGLIDLATPANSRIVLKVGGVHNCWSNDCSADAAEIKTAIDNLDALIPVVAVDPRLVKSAAQILEEDGIVASGGGRFEDDVIAKWEFREGEGVIVADTSGVQPEIPLNILGEFEWFGGWGVRLSNGRVQGAVSNSNKLADRIAVAGEYTIEAWIAPNNVTQEGAWIVGYAGGPSSRNLLLTQTLYNYDFYNRSTANAVNDGGPATSTEDADEIAQASLQHVVLSYDPFSGRKIYVNGVDTGVIDEQGPGNLSNWSDAFAIVLGNDFAGGSPWAGVIRMVAIHSKSLSPDQVQQNYDIGVGQKYSLMFSISEYLNPAACRSRDGQIDYCYVVFQVSQFDSASYLFSEPRFVNIHPEAASTPLDFDLEGIYLGINGQLARSGQGFVNIKAALSGSRFTIEDTPLQQAGTIIPLENGPDKDVFFLAFEDINGQLDGRAAPAIGAYDYAYQADPAVGSESLLIGMRTFDEINQSFSWITGVPIDSTVVSAATGKTVSETFGTVRRSLASGADFQTFMASHQMAIIQLAAAYCDALVEDDVLRPQMFPLFDFDEAVAGVADPTWSDEVIDPLVDKAYATGLENQANRAADIAALRTALLNLIVEPANSDDSNGRRLNDGKADGLKFCDGACPTDRTVEIVKAVCTTVLASAGATIK